MKHDQYGAPIATQSEAAREAFDRACDLIRLYRGDPVAALDEALAADPDFALAWAVRAGLLAQQTDALYDGEIARSLRAGFAASNRDARSEAHLAAARAWAEGRFNEGTSLYGRIALSDPRDLIALQFGHVGCFFVGRASDLRDWPLQSLRAHRRGDPGYHAVLGMAAFGLEECGDYERADGLGREAAAIEPRDGWAVHAVAHVNEMRGDVDAGAPWLADNARHWAPDSGFAYHNWWHLALLYVDRVEHDKALAIYDEKVRPDPRADVLMEWIDASALLWRLRLEGVDVGDRFAPLADVWARTVEDRRYAFNDLHAIMAFLGAGRLSDAERTLAAMRKAAEGEADNAWMTRQVGLPLAQGFIAFERGAYADAFERIVMNRGGAHRFGGSHAQRDVLTLTALHAALRGGMKSEAEALATERLQHKPHSPWAAGLARRARSLGDSKAA